MKNIGQFKSDVLWNLGSVLILAISGLILNVLIGVLYDAAALGIFNQVLAVYVFFSMFAVGGVNLSVLKLLAESPTDKPRAHQVILSASVLTVLLSALVTCLFFSVRHLFAALLQSPEVADGIVAITPGLFFFGLNKTLLGVVNGLHQMKAFAIFQALRYFNLLTGFCLALWFQLESGQLSAVFSFSEVLLFLVLVIHLREYWRLDTACQWRKWIRYHLLFGSRSVFSGALLELNSRIDVLLLGYFADDRTTGIYSFAAFLFEGLMHFLFAIQNNYNPHLSRLLANNAQQEFLALFRSGRNMIYRYALILIPVAIALYPLAVTILFSAKPEFMLGWLPFTILMGGMFLASGYIPFQAMLAMGGAPSWHTLLMLCTVLVNATLNYLLIPQFQIAGAALGMALTLVLSVLIMIVLVRVRLRLVLF